MAAQAQTSASASGVRSTVPNRQWLFKPDAPVDRGHLDAGNAWATDGARPICQETCFRPQRLAMGIISMCCGARPLWLAPPAHNRPTPCARLRCPGVRPRRCAATGRAGSTALWRHGLFIDWRPNPKPARHARFFHPARGSAQPCQGFQKAVKLLAVEIERHTAVPRFQTQHAGVGAQRDMRCRHQTVSPPLLQLGEDLVPRGPSRRCWRRPPLRTLRRCAAN